MGGEKRAVRNLVLIGFMGAGKSTVGRVCASKLGFAFRDSDMALEARLGCAVAEYFAREGEAAFREQERAIIAELAAGANQVISTGGGAILDSQNAERLRANGFVVLLTASTQAILRRVGDARTRPLLAGTADPKARVEELLATRLPRYRETADAIVDTSERSPLQAAEGVVAAFRAARG